MQEKTKARGQLDFKSQPHCVRDISNGLENVPVCLHESINDSASITSSFQYVTRVTCGPGVNVDFDRSMYPGCNCPDVCVVKTCQCIVRYEENYDEQCRLLKMENSEGICLPIFECNSNCRCGLSCINRISQQGLTFNLEVFDTGNRGLGVRTLVPILRYRFIAQYTGELIRYEEAKRRTADIWGKARSNFLLVLREHVAGGSVLKTHIDAVRYGSVTRFFNHSCNANTVIFPVRHNSVVPKLCIFAARDIESGEELTFSYGDTLSKHDSDNYSLEKDKFARSRIKCLCEDKKCVGFLPFEASLYDQ